MCEIEDDLLREVKELASQKKVTLEAVLNDALRNELLRASKPKSDTTFHPLNTFPGDGLCEGVDLNDSSHLLEIMERS